jgi:Ras-related protein Rab-11A
MYFREITSTEIEIKEDYSYKIIVIGNSGVGKSNFILKILGKEFQSDSPTTIGVELFSKYFQVTHTYKGKNVESIVKINLWDTAGQERYKSVTSSYYKGAKGVFVLYDLTKQETFESVDEWIKDANLYCQHKPSIMIIGTKSDLSNLKIIDELKQKAKADFYSKLFKNY